MSFLLDTNLVSETTRPQPSAVVLDWIAAQAGESLFISAITIGELLDETVRRHVESLEKEVAAVGYGTSSSPSRSAAISAPLFFRSRTG